MCEGVGSKLSGKTPNMLLISTKENRAISSGRYLRKSCPIMSRAIVFRTKKYAVSPRYWPLLGTMALLRAMINQKTKIKITEIIGLEHVLVKPLQPRNAFEQWRHVEAVHPRGLEAFSLRL